MGRTLVTPKRVPALLAAVTVLATIAMPNALASGNARTVRSGWWWAAQVSSAAPLPVPFATEPGELVVSRHGGVEEKAAAVWIDLSDLRSAPTSAVVELSEVGSDVALPVSGGLLACPVVNTPWEPAQGGAWSKRPSPNCISTDMAIGTRSPDGTWSFDLTNMTGSWLAGALPNLGFAIVPGQSLRYPSFEVALLAPGTDQIRLRADAPDAPAAPSTPTPAAVSGQDAPTSAPEVFEPAPAPASPSALPRTTQRAVQPTGAASTKPATSAPAASSDPRVALVGTVVHRPLGSNDLPVHLGLLAVVGGVCAAFALSKRRAAPET